MPACASCNQHGAWARSEPSVSASFRRVGVHAVYSTRIAGSTELCAAHALSTIRVIRHSAASACTYAHQQLIPLVFSTLWMLHISHMHSAHTASTRRA